MALIDDDFFSDGSILGMDHEGVPSWAEEAAPRGGFREEDPV